MTSEKEEPFPRLVVTEEEWEPVGELGLAQTRSHTVLDIGTEREEVESAFDRSEFPCSWDACHRDSHSEGTLFCSETGVEATDLVTHPLLFALTHHKRIEKSFLLVELRPGLDGSFVSAAGVRTGELVGSLDTLSDEAFLVLGVVGQLEEEGLKLEENGEDGVATGPAFVESFAGGVLEHVETESGSAIEDIGVFGERREESDGGRGVGVVVGEGHAEMEDCSVVGCSFRAS